MTKAKMKSVWLDYPSLRHLASIMTSVAVVAGGLWWFAEPRINRHIKMQVNALDLGSEFSKKSDVTGLNEKVGTVDKNVGDVSKKVEANSKKIIEIDKRGVRLEAETKAINDKVDDVRATLRNIERYMMERSAR